MNQLTQKLIALHLRLVRSEDGVAVMEYGLLVALISVLMLVGLKAIGISLQSALEYVGGLLSTAAGS